MVAPRQPAIGKRPHGDRVEDLVFWTLFTFQAMLSLFRLRHQRYWQHVRAGKITQSFCGRRERCASWRSVWGVIAMSVLVKDVLVATQRRASCSGSRVNIAHHGPATKRRLPRQRTLLTSNLRTCRPPRVPTTNTGRTHTRYNHVELNAGNILRMMWKHIQTHARYCFKLRACNSRTC